MKVCDVEDDVNVSGNDITLTLTLYCAFTFTGADQGKT